MNKDIDPKKAKEIIKGEKFQNTLIMIVEHAKKCEFCGPLAESITLLEQTVRKHMEQEDFR